MALKQRQKLQNLLLEMCDNVYFQPPNSLKMTYDCIVYHRENLQTRYADNAPYRHMTRYSLTVITKEPDSALVDSVAGLPMTKHSRFYTADNLNHDVFDIYF